MLVMVTVVSVTAVSSPRLVTAGVAGTVVRARAGPAVFCCSPAPHAWSASPGQVALHTPAARERGGFTKSALIRVFRDWPQCWPHLYSAETGGSPRNESQVPAARQTAAGVHTTLLHRGQMTACPGGELACERPAWL